MFYQTKQSNPLRSKGKINPTQHDTEFPWYLSFRLKLFHWQHAQVEDSKGVEWRQVNAEGARV
eukprot:gene16659-22724_t